MVDELPVTAQVLVSARLELRLHLRFNRFIRYHQVACGSLYFQLPVQEVLFDGEQDRVVHDVEVVQQLQVLLDYVQETQSVFTFETQQLLDIYIQMMYVTVSS